MLVELKERRAHLMSATSTAAAPSHLTGTLKKASTLPGRHHSSRLDAAESEPTTKKLHGTHVSQLLSKKQQIGNTALLRMILFCLTYLKCFV